MTYLGLRPGEKLYEELLVKTEELDKTENDLIFREKDRPLSVEQIREKLRMLKDVCDNGDDDQAIIKLWNGMRKHIVLKIQFLM